MSLTHNPATGNPDGCAEGGQKNAFWPDRAAWEKELSQRTPEGFRALYECDWGKAPPEAVQELHLVGFESLAEPEYTPAQPSRHARCAHRQAVNGKWL